MHHLESNRDYRTNATQDLRPDGLQRDITDYYDGCHELYLKYWCDEESLALHYGYWDSSAPYRHQEALVKMNAYLYAQAGIQPGERVLDAGCGVGGSAIWMARERGNPVVGISLSARQIHAAREFAERHGVSELTQFEVADYLQTPFPDASFDVIWAVESLCHCVDKGEFLREAFRLLRPNGRLAISDAFMLQREIDATQWQTLSALLDGWRLPNLCILDDFRQMLTAQGFREVVEQDVSAPTRPSSEFMYRQARRYMPLTRLGRWLGLLSPSELTNEQAAMAQYRVFGEGLARQTVFTARK